MVGSGVISPLAEFSGQVFCLLFTQAVHDAGIIFMLPDIGEQCQQGIFLRYDPVLQVLPVETAGKFPCV